MRNQSNYLILGLVLVVFGCSTGDHDIQSLDQLATAKNQDQVEHQLSVGATQISGVGFFDQGECDIEIQGADFALKLTGDLEGCLFVFVESFGCSPSGTYREQGQEYFVGTYHGEQGTFWTNYRFEAKYEGCEDGFFLGAEIFGRCQHPVQKGSGDGVFEGVTGRIDFKDDVETGDLPYRGHLRW